MSTIKGEMLLVLGGNFHDFAGYGAVMEPVFEAQGYKITATYDLDTLTGLDATDGFDLVLMYTCLGSREPLTPAENVALDGLVAWVAGGGRFVAAHAATVTAKHHEGFAAMVGGYFIEHPPQFAFPVTPMGRAHPVIADLPAFAVYDEFYIQHYTADVEIHLVASDRGVAYPMAWTRRHGAGRVANVALGHSERVWRLSAYQQLMVQTVDWAMGDRATGQ